MRSKTFDNRAHPSIPPVSVNLREMSTVTHSTFLTFVLLGFGSGWSLADAMYGNMAAFMAALPEGLLLPSYAEIVGKITVAVVTIAAALLPAPSLSPFQHILWALYALGFAGCLLGAFAWHSTAAVLILFFFAYAVGTVTIVTVFPLLPLFYEEALLSAVFTGNGLGCLVTGALSLLQAAVPAFSPTAYMLALAGLIACAAFSWAHVVRTGLALRPAFATKAASAAGAAPPPKVAAEDADEGAPLLLKEKAPRRATYAWVWGIAPMCAITYPVAATTWGVAPTLLPFATAHAGCSCDTQAREPQLTYYLATSIGFMLMPCAGLVSYARPCFHVPTLSGLALLHLSLACVVFAAAAGAPSLACSAAARGVVVASVSGTRALETYLSSCTFRMVVRRLEGEPATQRKASLAFGQGLMFVQFVFGALAFALAQLGAVRCTLTDGA